MTKSQDILDAAADGIESGILGPSVVRAIHASSAQLFGGDNDYEKVTFAAIKTVHDRICGSTKDGGELFALIRWDDDPERTREDKVTALRG